MKKYFIALSLALAFILTPAANAQSSGIDCVANAARCTALINQLISFFNTFQNQMQPCRQPDAVYNYLTGARCSSNTSSAASTNQSTSADSSTTSTATRQTVFDVLDASSGDELGNVSVRVERSNGTLIGNRTTGGDGETTGITLTVGENYRAIFTLSGYQTRTDSFTVPSGTGFYRRSPSMTRSTSNTQTTATPTITMKTPVVNSYWTTTDSPVMTWDSSGLAGKTLTVELFTPSNSLVSTFPSFTTTNDGSEPSRLLGSSVPTGWYYLRLRTTATVNGQTQTIYGGTGVFHFTNDNQTTTPPPTNTVTPTITITSPIPNAEWRTDYGHTVTWSTNGIGGGTNLTMELLTPSNGSVSGFNAFTTPNDYNESFSLSSVAPGWYYFRLKAIVNGQTIYGGSPVFHLVAPPVVTTPSIICGNGIIETGEQCDSSNFGGATCATYGMTIGSLTCSSSCTLSTNQCSNPPINATITVTSPTASSVWSSSHTVTWTDTNVPDSNMVTIELLTPSNGQVSGGWDITTPNSPSSKGVNISAVTPGFYYFRLKAVVSGQTIYGGSPVFQIQ